jgi:hypothetical protein
VQSGLALQENVPVGYPFQMTVIYFNIFVPEVIDFVLKSYYYGCILCMHGGTI